MKSKKFLIALVPCILFAIAHASAETYGNSFWYHVAGGNSVSRFESGVDTYSRSDSGHYILFGSWDTVKFAVKRFSGVDLDAMSNLMEAIDGDLAKFYGKCETLKNVYNILTRPSSSYDAMKAYAANDGDWWYAVIWIPY